MEDYDYYMAQAANIGKWPIMTMAGGGEPFNERSTYAPVRVVVPTTGSSRQPTQRRANPTNALRFDALVPVNARGK